MKPLRRRSSARHGGRNRDAREQARLTSHPPSIDDETLSVDVIACPRSQEDHRAYEFTGDIKSALRETLSKVKQPCGRTFEILRTPPPLRRDPLHNLSLLVSLAMSAEFISVAIYPGAIELTLTPLLAHSLERALPRPRTPCLAAVYAGTVNPPAKSKRSTGR